MNITKRSSNRIFVLGTGVSALFIAALFYGISYVDNEGFNPSDEGVILAQSFRILNGEIPHKDFISIRPVFSGILHTIHFFSPFPLVVSGRIFVILEFFVFSFLWAFIICSQFEIGIKHNHTMMLYFISLGIVCFILNVNTFLLFPWTTIDGIFLSVISFVLLMKGQDQSIKYGRGSIHLAMSLCFISLAALSKQNFIILTFLTFGYVMYLLFVGRQYKVIPLVVLVGVIPFILYLSLLLFTDALPFFINQMTGRTELIQTGVRSFVVTLIRSRFLPFNIVMISLAAFAWLGKRKKYFAINGDLGVFVSGNKKIICFGMIGLYLGFTMLASFYFLGKHNHAISIELFWILLILMFTVGCVVKLSRKQFLVLIFALGIAWSSSISTGANSPVFATGILVSTIVVLIIFLTVRLGLIKLQRRGRKVLILVDILLISSLFITGLWSQRRTNYRDLSSKYLTHHLGQLLPEFGGIKTNLTTYAYYSDFMQILNSYENIKDHFVMVPNNAIIYPLLNSRNPFPLDWLQEGEYIGSEDQLLDQINDILDSRTIYFFIDKYDSKYMAYNLKQKKYNKEQYIFMDLLFNKCEKIHTDSKYFQLYKSKKTKEF
ncbi:MAG: hypothetical protein GY845_31155 [Planctomycetes bacterium]|nr:hypothetical protein [Planctomycetota bacterium]